MDKKYNFKPRYLAWIIIYFIIIAPISLSYNSIYDFRFDVIHYPSPAGTFLFTLPISIFFVTPIILLGLLNLFRDLEIFLLSIIILISSTSFIFHENLSHLLLLIKIVIPIFALLGFEIFFKKKFLHIEKKNLANFLNNYSNIITLIFLITFFIAIISPFYLNSRYDWLINGITIFDYHQYFPLIFILLCGMLVSNKQRYLFILIYLLSFYLSFSTSNNTLFIFLIIFGIYYALCLLGFLEKKYKILLSKIVIISTFLILFLYPFFIYFLQLEIIKLDLPTILTDKRFILIDKFFNNLEFLEFLSPIRTSSNIVDKYYHNEFLVIVSAIGIIGVFLFYFVMLKRIAFISNYFPLMSVALSLLSLLSGTVVTVNLHPYTLIILSFFISYYYVLSKIYSQQSLQAV